MKLTIKSIPQLPGFPNLWQVKFNGKTETFNNPIAAHTYAHKTWKRYYKESAAASMLSKIAVNLLSFKDAEFISELCVTGVVGITPKQYGYLKGIYERQEKAW